MLKYQFYITGTPCNKPSVAERVKLLLWGHPGEVMQEQPGQPLMIHLVKLEIQPFITWVGTVLGTTSFINTFFFLGGGE